MASSSSAMCFALFFLVILIGSTSTGNCRTSIALPAHMEMELPPLLACKWSDERVNEAQAWAFQKLTAYLLEGGWPLGLQPLNVRLRLIRSLDFSGSLSFNTLTSGSPTCSSITSADLDSESTGSFFHERSITLGSLIGITSSTLELSSRSLRSRRQCSATKEKKSCKASRACFSLCPRAQLGSNDAAGNAPSLGHFLEVERRACKILREIRDQLKAK